MASELPEPKRRQVGEKAPSSSSSSSSSSSGLGALARQQEQQQQQLVAVKMETAGAKAAAESAQDSLTCAICFERPRAVVYLPCAHLSACADCDGALEAAGEPCPICRQAVAGRVRGVRLP